jgi:hypothetical protein
VHQAVVESTGAWYWLADRLGSLEVELVLAHATRVKAIARLIWEGAPGSCP